MDYIELSVVANRIAAFCDETVAVLCRAAFSPNIRDRLNFSGFIVAPEGELRAQTAHIPMINPRLPPALCPLLPA